VGSRVALTTYRARSGESAADEARRLAELFWKNRFEPRPDYEEVTHHRDALVKGLITVADLAPAPRTP
jgi:hypothetical protein